VNQAPTTGLGELMLKTTAVPKGSTAIKLYSSRDELWTMSYHRTILARESVAELVRAMIKMIRDPDNLDANRVMLFEILPTFCDVMREEIAAEVVAVAVEYAGDFAVLGHPLYGRTTGNDMLFVNNGASPQEVRGKALIALALMGRHHSMLVSAALIPALRTAITSSDPQVRRYAYEATGIALALARQFLPAIAGGTRDAHPNAANIALQVCGDRADAIIADQLLPVVLGSLEAQYRSPDQTVRFGAAKCAAKLLAASAKSPPSSLPPEVPERLKAVADYLRKDICRTIRRVLALDDIE
jgi:hypothetical protein